MVEQNTQNLVAVNEYGFYEIPAEYKTREVSKILLSGDVYEPNTIKLIRRLCKSGDVVSGGAFIGDFAPAISSALAEGARLHTFEPVPLSFQACQTTLALNDLTNVALHPVAVGREAGRLPIQIAKPGGTAMGARAKISKSHTEGETTMVDVVTIDTLVGADRPVSIVHLDIEGHEFDALVGAQDTIAAHAPVIILEAEKPWMQRDYQAKLRTLHPKLGYRFAGSMERNAFYLPTD